MTKAENAIVGMALIGVIFSAVFIFGILPLLVIWAVNTLLGLGIEYTIWTWLATLILLLLLPSGYIGAKLPSFTKR